MEGVDDLEKGETVEIRVSRINFPDSVLTHQDGGMGVVEQITGQVWKLLEELISDSGMAVGFDQNPQPR